MKFIELLSRAYNLIDETDVDEQVEIIVKNAINEAYSILCNMDVRLTRAYIPIVNGIANMPINCLKIIKTKPLLDVKDEVVGRNIITEKSGVIEILFNTSREPLVNDNDEPDLAEQLQYALINYAAYKYFAHRKRDNISNLFFSNYTNTVMTFDRSPFNVEEVVREV
ncbi:MAG: hypothetical protein ACRC2K_13300 [Clostridium sp.]